MQPYLRPGKARPQQLQQPGSFPQRHPGTYPAAAAFDSVVSTNTWIDRRLRLMPGITQPANGPGQDLNCGCRTR
jgi:hypothetical protein